MREAAWRHFDFALLGVVAVLTIFGITMINSAVAGNIELAGHSQRQLIFAILGFGMLFLIAAIDYHLWSSLNRPVYITMVVVLAILLGANAVFGSSRWFTVATLSVQPSEFAKIVIILVLAEYFTHNLDQVGSLMGIARSFILTFGIVIWVYLQPNLSTSIVIVVIWASMLFISGLKVKHMLLFGVSGLIGSIAIFPFLQDYQKQRILNFINPDPSARHGAIYNIQQALISIGSGGWLGEGYRHGTQVQLRFLRAVRHSDFIFASMAEEFGFVGTVLIILLLVFVIYRCLRAARLARDTFGALICYGVATLIAFQAVVNIGVNLNLLPATGLPLPFISYGGTSLFSLLIGIGLVESVVLRQKALEF